VAQVVTGEAVVLEVPCARFPSRMLAFAIDLTIQLAMVFILLAIVGLGTADHGMNAAAAAAVVITVIVLVIVGYPVVWETTTRGRSPGKFALGLRVVSDDGSPERFRQALVRGLATVVDFWLLPFFGVPALICSLLSERGKRLGDVFAGTFVIQHRLPAQPGAAAMPPVIPAELAAWASGLELSGLGDQTAAMARRYLGRLPELTPGARAELGERISAAVRAQVGPPPPGTPATAYLGAVLAERHRREHARLVAPGAAGAEHIAAPPAGTGPAGAAPAGTARAAWTAPAGTEPAWVTPPAPAPSPPPPGPPWAAPGPPQAPGTEWTGAAGEGEGSQPGQPVQSCEPGEPASPPAAGTGFVPPE
jgi:uncharacterized RDD family membrane protein YckC